MDPILVSIIANRMRAVGRQMGTVIEKSTHSPQLVESHDFSMGLYLADGTLIEQTEYIPMLGYAAAPGVKAVIEYFGDDVHQGDVFLHNDTFSGGNQNADWKVVRPVFFDDQCVAWTVIAAHQAEVGGTVPGSYNPYATDLWQEGLRITPVKVYERGEKRRDVWDFIFGNVRLPVVADDIQAMIGGCIVGERELIRLLGQYGIKVFNEAVTEILDSAEKTARDIIKNIPNGVYTARCWAYDDGFNHEARMNIDVKITVEEEHMTFDFTGTHPQTKGYVNAPLAATVGSVMIAFFMLGGQNIAHNEAIQRCITIHVPEGTMLNPKFPAATGFGNHLSDQICSAIFLALSEALPDRITAGWNPLLATIMNGRDKRRNELYVDILVNACKGGGGGTFGADGYDHIGIISCGGAITAQDPEMFEIMNPFFLHKFEYAQDSAGAGQWRGGLGVETEFTILSGGAQASVFGDGATEETAAPGVLGGSAGSPNYIFFEYPDGERYEAKMKDLISDIPEGTAYKQLAGGGGGYGDPIKRPVDLVAREVRYGYISEEFAKLHYGVVMQDAKKGIIDKMETELIRNQR